MELNDYNKYSFEYQKTWDLFNLHAQQRIHFFNFFILLMSALVGLQITSIRYDLFFGWIGFGLGFLQILLCFVFYKFDERNKFLTKHSEKIIIKFEELFELGDYAVMKTQEDETKKIRDKQCRCEVLSRQYSFSNLINFIYFMYFLVSITLSLFAVL